MVVFTLGCESLVEGKGSTRCQVVVVEGGSLGEEEAGEEAFGGLHFGCEGCAM